MPEVFRRPPTSFRWDAAELFSSLEAGFVRSRSMPLEAVRAGGQQLELAVFE
jgi:hypothetical protein